MKRTSLQRLFILPFVTLLLCLTVSVGWLLYQAGQDATDALSQKVLVDMMGGINGAINRQLLDAGAALRVVAPDQLPGSAGKTPTHIPFPCNVGWLKERMWIATKLFPAVGGLVCFGGVDGKFVGIRRIGTSEFRIRLRGADGGPANLYRSRGPLTDMILLEAEQYEPREQNWYVSASTGIRDVWSALFIDESINEPVVMLARPVYRDEHTMLGVVARELSLKPLREYLQALPMDQNGVAFVAEGNGNLVVASNGDSAFGPALGQSGKKVRVNVLDTGSPLMLHSWQLVQKYMQQHSKAASLDISADSNSTGAAADSLGVRPSQSGIRISGTFPSELGQIEVIAQTHRDAAGLDWVAVVALPRSDF